MKKIIWLICGAYVVDLLFDLVPKAGPERSFFPFFHGYGPWNGQMTLHNYVYGYCQHVYLIMVFHAVYLHTGRKFWEWLMWLEVVDVVDYALHYNHTIFELFGFGIDFNYFKFIAVLFLTHHEYAKRT